MVQDMTWKAYCYSAS